MSSPLPWFKVEVLQVANDLSDVKSLDGEGAYFRVLRFLWLNGPQPIEQLRRKCQHVFDELEHVFSICSTGDEHLFSVKWLEAQRVKADEWRANKRAAGKASAETRASKSKTSNSCSTVVEQPTSTSTSTSTLTQEGKERARPNDGFEEFYKPYPLHKARGAAERAWAKLTKEERALCKPAIEAQVKANHFRGKDGKDYIPHPATWLNERRWLDEVVTTAAQGAPGIPDHLKDPNRKPVLTWQPLS